MKLHAFISYSRKNMLIAEDLVQELRKAAIPYWIDKEDIHSYDHSFEKRIREAIKSSWGAILLASPDSFDSDYVQGELDIIRERNIPLIILWIDGEYYTDTVPTFLTRKSYIDYRSSEKNKSLSQIIKTLKELWISTVPNFQRVALSRGQLLDIQMNSLISTSLEGSPPPYNILHINETEQVIFSQSRFHNTRHFLDDLYRASLTDIYPAYSYGEKWAIGTETDFDNTFFSIAPAYIHPKQLILKKKQWQDQPLKLPVEDARSMRGFSSYRIVSLGEKYDLNILYSNQVSWSKFILEPLKNGTQINYKILDHLAVIRRIPLNKYESIPNLSSNSWVFFTRHSNQGFGDILEVKTEHED